jgi:ATP-dependent Clp protease ATP-binding subunit ClpA
LTDSAKTHLVKAGYDPVYGARPLKRAIQRELETALGKKILGGEIKDGDTVEVGFDDGRGELTFSSRTTQELPAAVPV